MKKLLITTALVAGLTFTAAVAAPDASAPAAAPPSYIDQALAQLPQDKAEQFRDTMSQAHEHNRDVYEQIHQTHQDLHDILIAPKFDKSAFLSKSHDLRKLHDQIGANIDKSFANAVETLSPAERQTFADSLENSHEQHVADKTDHQQ